MNVRIEYNHTPERHGKQAVIMNMVEEGTDKFLCHCVIHERENIVRIMTLITTPGSRRLKLASKMMDEVVGNLDRIKKVAYLEVDAFELSDHQGESTGMNDEQLRYWYGRFGFDDVPGHPFAMVRYPK